jgi:N-acetylneuraminate synthase
MSDYCMIVAELGINANGDIDIAKKMIKNAKEAGCDFVKFQKRTIDVVYSKEELDKPRESPWGSTTREQKEGLEFNREEYDEIDRYCEEIGIKWFASPWDIQSVKFLEKYNCPYIKIPSALITDIDLLEEIRITKIPVIMSTGMSTQEEVRKATKYLGSQIEYLLACTSTYPTVDEEVNLRFITTLKKEYPHYRIGFSNHSPSAFFVSASAALGSEMIEFHYTLDRAMYGSDQAASIETGGMKRVVAYVRGIQRVLGTGEWTVFPSEEKIKQKLRKK